MKACVVGIALAVTARCTLAQELTALWESDAASQYGWLNIAHIIPMRGPHSLVLSASAARLAYEYADVEGKARVRSTGGALGAGYRLETDRVEVTAQLGYALRRTSWIPVLSPGEAWNERGAVALAEAYATLTPRWLVSAVASYDGILTYDLGRVALQHRLGADADPTPLAVWVGIDATVQGSSDERARQMGGVMSLEFLSGTWFEIRGGLGRWHYDDGTRESMPYWSMALTRRFR